MPVVGVERVGVVGCGLMGSGIAEVCARAGLDVVVREVSEVAIEQSRRRIRASLGQAVAAGKIGSGDADTAWERLRFTTDYEELSDRQLVIEAVQEDAASKLEVFSRLDEVVEDPSAVLASNTSSIPIMKLAMATRRPDMVVGLHFFNPAPVMDLVEVVSTLLTSAATRERAESFARHTLGKDVIRCNDRAGYVVTALLVPYLLSAIRMLESGYASAIDIDTGAVKGLGHPMGPLALADLIGLDTTMAVAQSLYEEFKEPSYAPPPLLRRMVEAGLLGRKNGHGFWSYPDR